MDGVLKVWSTDIDHCLYVAFKENSSLENTSDGIDSSKKVKFLIFILLFKRAQGDLKPVYTSA